MSEEISKNLDELNQLILEGKIMEAMRRFYTEDVVMGENDQPPTVGLKANLKREQGFVDNTTWHGIELKAVAVGDGVSMAQWWMDFTNESYGGRLTFTQVAVQRWRDGKIYDERFYYSPAATG